MCWSTKEDKEMGKRSMCRMHAPLEKVRNCKYCGRTFSTYRNEKYCSNECFKLFWNNYRKIRNRKIRDKLGVQ